MHFSPYHKKKTWQKFLLGIVVGAIFTYMIFIYMYGKMYENILTSNIQLKTEISELQKQHEVLSDQKEALEQNVQYAVQSIDIQFTNEKQFTHDKLIRHQLADLVKKDLDQFIGKSVQSVAENDTLLIKLIENNMYTIDELTFQLQVKKLFIHEKLTLYISMKKVK